MPERRDWIEIALSRDVVTLPWASRDSLLEQLTRGAAREIRPAFEAHGAEPIKLTLDEKVELARVIETWSGIVGGYGGLPVGVFNLRNALLDDLASD